MARQAQEVKEYKELDSLMPVGFVGHGAPTLGLEKEGPTVEAWREWGKSIPRPKAILVVSAHSPHSWMTRWRFGRTLAQIRPVLVALLF